MGAIFPKKSNFSSFFCHTSDIPVSAKNNRIKGTSIGDYANRITIPHGDNRLIWSLYWVEQLAHCLGKNRPIVLREQNIIVFRTIYILFSSIVSIV